MDEREEIETLLPWFVTGKLDAVERVRVEAYLAQHPDMARQVALAREESTEVTASAERFGSPSRGSFDRLMAQVASQPKRSAVSGGLQAGAPFLERVADWIGSFSRVQLGGMAVAAMLLLAVQAAAMVYLATRGGETYQTASGPSASASDRGTFALVSFKPAATAQEIATFLSEVGAQVVDGPRAGGLWRVRLSAEALSQADADARLTTLRQKTTVVAFASLTP